MTFCLFCIIFTSLKNLSVSNGNKNEADEIDVEIEMEPVADTANDDKPTAPPPPAYFALIRDNLSDDELQKVMSSFSQALERPTAMIPEADLEAPPESLNIPPLKPISDKPIFEHGADADTENAPEVMVGGDDGYINVLKLMLENADNQELNAAYQFLMKIGLDLDPLIDALYSFEFEGSQMVEEDMIIVFSMLVRQALLILKNLMEGKIKLQEHKLVHYIADRLPKIREKCAEEQLTAEEVGNKLLHLAYLMTTKSPSKTNREQQRVFLEKL